MKLNGGWLELLLHEHSVSILLTSLRNMDFCCWWGGSSSHPSRTYRTPWPLVAISSTAISSAYFQQEAGQLWSVLIALLGPWGSFSKWSHLHLKMCSWLINWLPRVRACAARGKATSVCQHKNSQTWAMPHLVLWVIHKHNKSSKTRYIMLKIVW
jgi:hypothetical protein